MNENQDDQISSTELLPGGAPGSGNRVAVEEPGAHNTPTPPLARSRTESGKRLCGGITRIDAVDPNITEGSVTPEDLRVHVVAEDPRYPTMCVNGDMNFGMSVNAETGMPEGARGCICAARGDDFCICDLGTNDQAQPQSEVNGVEECLWGAYHGYYRATMKDKYCRHCGENLRHGGDDVSGAEES